MFEELANLLDALRDGPLAPVVLIGGLITLIAGGHVLVDSSIALARRLGLSPLLIGMTIVAFGTSAPELAFNIIAAVDDNSDLSFGNIVGSNIANLGLVLGLAALVTPLAVSRRITRIEFPTLIVVSLVMTGLALWVPRVAVDGTARVAGFERIDGLIMLGLFMVFMLVMLRLARKDRAAVAILGLDDHEPKPSLGTGWRSALGVVIGLTVLLSGGKLAEIGAVGTAMKLNMSQATIALTVVAIATSLPEVAASFIAAKKGEADLAVGNVVGSNLFNILLVLGATAAISPVRVPRYGTLDLIVMTGVTLLAAALVFAGRDRLGRRVGLVLLFTYAAYMTFILLRESPVQAAL